MQITSRHETREAAFILIFESMFQKDCTADDLAAAASDCGLFEAGEDTLRYVKGVLENMQTLDEMISRFLVRWTLSRISKVSLAILRLAVYELLYCDGVAHDVVISEAVLLVSAYGYPEDVKFVNGLLGNLNRSMEEKGSGQDKMQ